MKAAEMLKKIDGIAIMLAAAFCGVASADTEGYFPEWTFDLRPDKQATLDPKSERAAKRHDRFINRWYSKHLRAMSEPVLKPVEGTRTYRFTWLRSFHHPVAVRIVAANNQFRLIATELDGAGGYEPGNVLRKKNVHLTPDQFKKLEELIVQSGFWAFPTLEMYWGFDGAEWILEGAVDKHHIVARTSPKSGPIRELGEQFLSLTGWDFKIY